MRTPPRAPGSALLGLALLLAAPATAGAAYDGSLRTVDLTDARPGAVSRPLTIRIAQDPMISVGPKEVRLAVQGFDVDSGTTTGRRIGTVDFETSLGPFRGFAVTTNGPGDGAPGRWSLSAPAIGTVSAAIRPGTDLDDAGTRVGAPNATLIDVPLPTALPFGARLHAVTVRLNVDQNGCRTAFPAATNPVPGFYRWRAFVVATDASTKLSDITSEVRAGAPAGGTPPQCPKEPVAGVPTTPGADPPSPAARPSVKVTRAATRVAPGRIVRFRVKVANGPVEVRVRRGTKTLKRLQRVGPSGRTFAFRAPRADAGRVVKLTFSPKGGTSKSLNVRVTR